MAIPEGEAFGRALDCGDNSCEFAVKIGGMRTNGGCRCIKNLVATVAEVVHAGESTSRVERHIRWAIGRTLVAQKAAAEERGRRAGLEEASKVAEGGVWRRADGLDAQHGREVAAAIRRRAAVPAGTDLPGEPGNRALAPKEPGHEG